MGQKRAAYKILVGRPEGKRPFGKTSYACMHACTHTHTHTLGLAPFFRRISVSINIANGGVLTRDKIDPSWNPPMPWLNSMVGGEHGG